MCYFISDKKISIHYHITERVAGGSSSVKILLYECYEDIDKLSKEDLDKPLYYFENDVKPYINI